MASAQNDDASALPHPPEWYMIEAQIQAVELATSFTRRLRFRINGIPDAMIPPLPRNRDDEEEESRDDDEEESRDDEEEESRDDEEEESRDDEEEGGMDDEEDDTDNEEYDDPDDESDMSVDGQGDRFEAIVDIRNLQCIFIFDKQTRKIMHVQLACVDFEELVQALLWHLGMSNTVASLQLLLLSYEVYSRGVFERQLEHWRDGPENLVSTLVAQQQTYEIKLSTKDEFV
ncbi:hypothetical protein M407DRAFT_24522 [Tulasnella calospora MUT 4182]|uniref:Uncharacterized protein n=1 Tax=Tulasnella calospora MUT 4182 TaxID=1051891 RepID=A0A0C3QHQ5_9AGAM|nr:hypothetical protein M407DRAFT_24522 [Tulasnella calospora MUT 4182]